MEIRKAEASDAPAIAEIIVPTIRDGTTYALAPDMTEAQPGSIGWGRQAGVRR